MSSETASGPIIDASATDTWRGGKSFVLSHRLYRATWSLTWLLLAAWTPPQLHAWRRVLLRAFGARIGVGAGVYPSARVWFPANLEMGDYAFIGPGVNCYCMAKITLGPYALVSQGAHLCAGTHDIEDVNFQLKAFPIVIGRRAWVASEAFVGPGVTIEEGAVLGARGVAVKDLKSWTVYAGNPAVPIRSRSVRFDDDSQAARGLTKP